MYRICNLHGAPDQTSCYLPTNLEDPNVRAMWHANWSTRFQTLHALQNVTIGQALNDWKPNVIIEKDQIQVDDYVRYYINKTHNIMAIGKCIELLTATKSLKIVKCVHPNHSSSEKNKQDKQTKKRHNINEYTIIETDEQATVHEDDVIGHSKFFEQLLIHWGKSIMYEKQYIQEKDSNIFHNACKNDDILMYLQHTKILDQFLPTHFLRILNEKNEPCFPYQCGEARNGDEPCEFEPFTKWHYLKTPLLMIDGITEIVSERYTCKTHKKV